RGPRDARACAVVPVPLRAGALQPRADTRVGDAEVAGEGAALHPREPDPDSPDLPQAEVHAGRGVLDARRGHRTAALAAGPLPDPAQQALRAPAQVRRTALLQTGLHRLDDRLREGHEAVSLRAWPTSRPSLTSSEPSTNG